MQAGTEEANSQSAGTEAGSETLSKEALAATQIFRHASTVTGILCA